MSLYSKLDKNILFPFAEKVQGSNILGSYKFLKKSEWWSREQIDSFQQQQLRKLIQHSVANVPYYTDLFKHLKLSTEDIIKVSDLQKLPILTKQIIRDNYDKLFSKDIETRKTKAHTTGGSTGVPLQFKTDMKGWNMQWASTFRAFDWYGFDVGEKIFTIGGQSLVSEKKSLSKKDVWDKYLMRNFKYSSSGMKEEDMAYYYKQLIQLKPKAIRGYASSIFVFAKYIENNNLSIPNIKLLLTTGEQLMPNYRAKLQEIFKAPLYDGYGAGDGGILTHECYMHEGYHITEESSIIEICNRNGAILSDGEVGNVIATDLNNFSFPFIRYKVGDMANIEKNICSCGRKSKLIGKVLGRTGKLLYTKTGVPVSPTMLPILLYHDLDFNKVENQYIYNKIDRFQIVQDKYGDLKVLLKLKNQNDNLQQFKYIRSNYNNSFPGSNVEIMFVDEIKPLASGKDDYVISKFTKF